MLEHLPLDEKWNVYTHGFGAVMSLVGSVLLLNHLNELNTTTTYGLFLFMVFYGVFIFCISHIPRGSTSEQQAFWQKIDHIGIYFFNCWNLHACYTHHIKG